MPTVQEVFDAAARYQIAGTTGAVAAGASTKIIFYMQNTSATKMALIERVKVSGHIATTAYAVGQVLYELHIARGFTAENGTPTSLSWVHLRTSTTTTSVASGPSTPTSARPTGGSGGPRSSPTSSPDRCSRPLKQRETTGRRTQTSPENWPP